MGSMPLVVRGTYVGSSECSGRGFTASPCLRDAVLAPQQSVAIAVHFVPDFMAAQCHEHLRFVTSVGTIALPVEATIPLDVLATCHFATPELPARASSVLRAVLLLSFVVVVAAAVAGLLQPAAPVLLPVVAPSSSGGGGGGGVTDGSLALREVLGDLDVEPVQDKQPVPKVESEEEGSVEEAPQPVVTTPVAVAEPETAIVQAAEAPAEPVVAAAAPAPEQQAEPQPQQQAAQPQPAAVSKGSNKKKAKKARRASGDVSSNNKSTEDEAPGIVKETVAIPPKFARVSSSGSELQRERERDRRMSEDSSHAESESTSSDDNDKLGKRQHSRVSWLTPKRHDSVVASGGYAGPVRHQLVSRSCGGAVAHGREARPHPVFHGRPRQHALGRVHAA